MEHSEGYNKKTDKLKSLYYRWIYMLRLLRLISTIAPKEMIMIMVITIGTGLVPLLSIFALQQLVNSITYLGNYASDRIPLEIIMWMMMLILALLLNSGANIYGGMIRDHIQERIKANIQKLIIHKTHRLSLAQFEDPKLYDQLQRANNGLESRLFLRSLLCFNRLRAPSL